MDEEKMDKEFAEMLAQLKSEDRELIFRMILLMAFGMAYDAHVSECGGPLPPDMLRALIDEWDSAHGLEVSA